MTEEESFYACIVKGKHPILKREKKAPILNLLTKMLLEEVFMGIF